MVGRESRGPDLDDWFAEPDQTRAQPTSSDAEGADESVDEDWLDARGSPSSQQHPDAWQLTRTQTVAVVAGALVVILIGLAVIGVFPGGSTHPPAPATTSTSPTPASTTPTRPRIGAVSPPTTTLKPGDQGAQVRVLQRALVRLGHPPGATDGNYGPATQKALEAFQSASGLAADGVLGPKTLAALTIALSKSG